MPTNPSTAPTDGIPEPQGPATGVVQRNIRALQRMREEYARHAGAQERLAAAITRFAGSMWCVYVHAILFGSWIIINLGWVPGVKRFDPDFVKLAMFASVEAIFLSTFILIGQNRMARLEDRRAELDLQVSLLAEHELTRLIEMVDAVADRLGVQHRRPEVEELKRDVHPELVSQEIERAEQEASGKS